MKSAESRPFHENIQAPPAAKPAVFNSSDFDSELPPILNNPYDNPTDDNKASVSPLIFIIPVIAAILAFLVGFLLMRAKGKTQNTAEVNTQQMTVFSRMPVYAGARTALTRTYFGGVTRILVPDNLKTGVTANTRYETQLNESYRELAEYYGTAIVPARVRKPQDKGLVERSVGFSTTWITAALREHRFFSFSEVKEAVAERLEFINTKPFQKRLGCRREAYLSEEKEFMLPLPKRPYEPAVWKQQTVGNDYLISDGLNKYSVPFDLIGEQVQIRLTRDLVEVYFKGSRMTSHKRLAAYSVQPVVKPEHMPDRHRKYLSCNVDEFRTWAKTVGKSTEEIVRHFLSSGIAEEQGYKACVSLRKLENKHGKQKLEAACERMLAFSSSPSIAR